LRRPSRQPPEITTSTAETDRDSRSSAAGEHVSRLARHCPAHPEDDAESVHERLVQGEIDPAANLKPAVMRDTDVAERLARAFTPMGM
jgi:hypothetical protein